MAPAVAALAPSLMSKAEGIAATILKESRQEIVKLRFNEELDVVGPDEHAVFSLTVTPALIGTIGAIGIAIYVIYAIRAKSAQMQGSKGDYWSMYRKFWGI